MESSLKYYRDGEITYTPGLMVLVLHSNKFTGSIPLELATLIPFKSRTWETTISGTIPRCFGNFNKMTKQWNSSSHFLFIMNVILNRNQPTQRTPVMKGVEYEYDNTLGLLDGMDLSSNKLYGEILKNSQCLHGLIFLNCLITISKEDSVKIGDLTSPSLLIFP
ncbi:hypothetical protein AAG906_008592 [Vitis piasezkii]